MNALAATLESAAAAADLGAGRDVPELCPAERRARESFAQDCEPLRFAEMMWFRERGVSPYRLLGWRHCPDEMGWAAFQIAFPGWPPVDLDFAVRRARVQFLRGGRIVFASDRRAEAGKLVAAFIVPAIVDAGGMIDLVAWHPKTGRIGSCERTAGWLAGGWSFGEDPLVVHPDPLSWLRAGREGIVVVHEDLARPALLMKSALQAVDVAHGEALQAMLTKVRLPRIVVPTLSHEDARAAA